MAFSRFWRAALRAKIAEHADRLSALMITYPSTHGVFEEAVTEICAAVHDAGGSVIAWTVNEVGDLQQLARLGVDGLCGNYPDRIRIALASPEEEVSHT